VNVVARQQDAITRDRRLGIENIRRQRETLEMTQCSRNIRRSYVFIV
jgi:hypothetical protein